MLAVLLVRQIAVPEAEALELVEELVELVKELVDEVKLPVLEVREPVAELVTEPVAELVTEPVAELVTEPVTELVTEPVAELVDVLELVDETEDVFEEADGALKVKVGRWGMEKPKGEAEAQAVKRRAAVAARYFILMVGWVVWC